MANLKFNLEWTLLTWLTCSSYLCLLFKLMGVVLGKFYHHFQNTSTFWLDWNWLERKFVFFKEKCSVSAKKNNTTPIQEVILTYNYYIVSVGRRGKGIKNRRFWYDIILDGPILNNSSRRQILWETIHIILVFCFLFYFCRQASDNFFCMIFFFYVFHRKTLVLSPERPTSFLHCMYCLFRCFSWRQTVFAMSNKFFAKYFVAFSVVFYRQTSVSAQEGPTSFLHCMCCLFRCFSCRQT